MVPYRRRVGPGMGCLLAGLSGWLHCDRAAQSKEQGRVMAAWCCPLVAMTGRVAAPHPSAPRVIQFAAANFLKQVLLWTHGVLFLPRENVSVEWPTDRPIERNDPFSRVRLKVFWGSSFAYTRAV